MNKILRFLPLTMYIFLMVYAGCSGNDEPKPFNCSESDLAITLIANGDVDPTTCSSNDGSIEVMATGGEGPYTFAIGTGNFGNGTMFSNLGAGTFTVIVQDQKKCLKQVIVELVAAGAPVVEVDATQDTNCTAPGNGTISVSASGGGSGSYQYKLDNGPFGANPLYQDVSSGGHTLVVKDDDDCTTTVNVGVVKGITGIDYVNDILPIFEAKCNFSGCHPDNGDWFTYSVAKSKASNIKSRTTSGSMPKGGSSAPGGALSATQIAKIACWVDDGAPEN